MNKGVKWWSGSHPLCRTIVPNNGVYSQSFTPPVDADGVNLLLLFLLLSSYIIIAAVDVWLR